MRLLLILLLCCFSFNSFAEGVTGEMKTVELDGKKIFYWSPETARKAPLVVFSHVFSGCAQDFRYLGRALAQDGFWAAAVNDKDSVCESKGIANKIPAVPWSQPSKWDDKTYADRKDDIHAMLEAMTKSEIFSKHVDFEHVGLAGHSLGGYIAMGMAGAWDSWKTHDIKAVVAFSPFNAPFLIKNTVNNIGVPIMYQGGTRDNMITPSLKKADGVYAQTHPDKYLVIFDGADHLAWTDHVTTFHTSIISYTLAFFDYYLKGNASAGKLMVEKLNDVHALYYDNRDGKVELPKDKPAAASTPHHKRKHH